MGWWSGPSSWCQPMHHGRRAAIGGGEVVQVHLHQRGFDLHTCLGERIDIPRVALSRGVADLGVGQERDAAVARCEEVTDRFVGTRTVGGQDAVHADPLGGP